MAVRAIGFVCDNLGLCGIPREAAWKVTDKLLMKEALKAGGYQPQILERSLLMKNVLSRLMHLDFRLW